MLDGRQEIVRWIPIKYAAKDQILNLKDPETGVWENGWKVLDEPGEPYMRESVLVKQSRDYRKTREASDISRR